LKKKKSPVEKVEKRVFGLSAAQRRMVLLLTNLVCFGALYVVIPKLGFYHLPIVYLIGGGALAIWFVIYNRGFNTRGKTPDMLPDSLSLSEREELIAEGNRRFARSRWALLVLIPLLVIILLDFIYLNFIPEGLFQ